MTKIPTNGSGLSLSICTRIARDSFQRGCDGKNALRMSAINLVEIKSEVIHIPVYTGFVPWAQLRIEIAMENIFDDAKENSSCSSTVVLVLAFSPKMMMFSMLNPMSDWRLNFYGLLETRSMSCFGSRGVGLSNTRILSSQRSI